MIEQGTDREKREHHGARIEVIVGDLFALALVDRLRGNSDGCRFDVPGEVTKEGTGIVPDFGK